MALFAISGKLNSGKDTVGNIIQWLIYRDMVDKGVIENPTSIYNDWKAFTVTDYHVGYKIKKFADKLKDIVCMILGCTRVQLEDRDFKEKELGKEWWYIKKWYPANPNKDKVFTLYPYEGFDSRIFDGDDSCMWEVIKTTPRLLLQLLGTDCGRDIIHPNVWVNSLMSEYKPNTTYRGEIWDFSPDGVKITDTGWRGEDKSSYPNWIITDTRFPNELQAVKDKGGISIRVNRHLKFPSLFEEPADDEHKPKPVEHPSETALDDAEFDYIIDNSGTIEELIEKVREILIKEQIL